MSVANPRIAVLGFAIECNRFAPVSTAQDFADDVDIRGEAIVADARAEHSIQLPAMPGFFREMDRGGPWTPVPLRVASAQPGGPVDQTYFDAFVKEIVDGLKAAGPLDGVFIASHGAALSTGSDDPDGDLFEAIRGVVGPDMKVIGVFDLHANVSRKMVDNLTVFVGYRTNPHMDIYDRGVEAAQHMREVLGGTIVSSAMVKIPLVPPQISLLTKSGPYADLMDYGIAQAGGRIMNVSVMAGFAYGDTPKNGFTAIVTARQNNTQAAQTLALDICTRAWAMRERFKRSMTSLSDAVAMAVAAGEGRGQPVLLADVADNPGGGGRGNTTYMLAALIEAKAKGVILGVFNDGPLALEAHALGVGKSFRAKFNRTETDRFSLPFEADATVVALSDGKFVGRRGLAKGVSCDLGASALLDLDGVQVVVISLRQQCLDPMQFELFGLDIAKARTVVVKSRGHFRGGFDEFFPDERIYEVDCPGLTSPILANFPWTRLPRPVYPLDENARWDGQPGSFVA
jgi:microcystin degradation protein MlrC